MRKIGLLFSSIYIVLTACTPEPKGFEPDAGSADFSNLIALGGSYMAGYQDGGLFLKAQENSLAALVANQLEYANGNKFHQVLLPQGNGIGLNSKPWESNFVTPSKLGNKTDCKGVTSISPIKSEVSDIVAQGFLNTGDKKNNNNLAVPFASIVDYTNPNLS